MRSFVALIVCIAAFELPTVAQDESLHGVREFTESGTWRVPAGVTSITIELWGAGGGGAGGATAAIGLPPAASGGGGGVARCRAHVTTLQAAIRTPRSRPVNAK
jgi:hypothetical protein